MKGFDEPFSTIRVTKQIASLNNKIIECRWSDNEWEFIGERKDKSYPNNVDTARGI